MISSTMRAIAQHWPVCWTSFPVTGGSHSLLCPKRKKLGFSVFAWKVLLRYTWLGTNADREVLAGCCRALALPTAVSARRRAPLNTAQWEARALYQLLMRRETRQTGDSREMCGITQKHSKKRNHEDIQVTKTCDWLLLLVMLHLEWGWSAAP